VPASCARVTTTARTALVSLADCVFLASAQPGDAVATLDAHLAAVARDEGVEVVDL
jgi:predicted nucleic acid-binding protein